MKHATWLENGANYKCSNCGNIESYYTDSYCRCCGARMDGDDQSDECGVYDDEGNKVSVCACGTEISPHTFEVADECYGETHKVQVLRCKNCGKLSFGWWKIE